MSYLFLQFNTVEIGLLIIWAVAIILPITYSIRNETPVSLGITMSVLAGSLVQLLAGTIGRWGWIDYWFYADMWLIPSRTISIEYFHTMFTAGFLHSQSSLMHVLGNVIILALVGVPLEQRLGSKRYLIIYAIGLFGGSLAWTVANLDSNTPSLGASGAAFGLLGAYLAGWPKDEIPFPILLIRPWPVTLIALLYFGLEVFRWFGTVNGDISNVAHMAHLGGFLAAYILLPAVAKGGPYELGVDDGGPSGTDFKNRARIKQTMVNISEIDDPWTSIGQEVPKTAVQILKKLKTEGDELETRIAWMEALADSNHCPICDEPLGLVERKNGPQVQCSMDDSHLLWPR